jgi:hypothetical protein
VPSYFVDLVLLSIASAIGPGQILICILLLQSPNRGVLKAGSLVGGMTFVRLLQGAVFGSILTGAAISALHRGQHGVITSTLLMVLGIILLIAAYEQWQHQDDGDGLLPKWLTIIDSLTPVKAFGIGAVLVAASTKFWAFTLSAIAVISEAHLSQLHSIVAFVLFILGAESLLLLTILIRIVMPERTTKSLNTMSTWLIKHTRTLLMAVSLLFGLFFLVIGISRLLAF